MTAATASAVRASGGQRVAACQKFTTGEGCPNACGRAAWGRSCQEMGVAPSRVVATRLTWVVVAGIIVLLVLAGIDALRGSGSESAVTAPFATAAADICGPQQLMLRVERLGDRLALALRNVTGKSCRSPRLPIEVTLLDRNGFPAKATASIQRAFRPTIHAPNIDVIAVFTVVSLCRKPEPELFTAEAGSYHGGGRLPATDAICVDDLGP